METSRLPAMACVAPSTQLASRTESRGTGSKEGVGCASGLVLSEYVECGEEGGVQRDVRRECGALYTTAHEPELHQKRRSTISRGCLADRDAPFRLLKSPKGRGMYAV